MRYLLTAILLAAMGGCGKPQQPVPRIPVVDVDVVCGSLPQGADCAPSLQEAASAVQSHEAQVYAELWNFCKKNGYSYRVWRGEITFKYYAQIRDGDHNLLWEGTASGPTEAVEKLLEKVKDDPPSFHTGEVKP